MNALEKFVTLFGLKLSHLLFGAAEEMFKVLQAKDTSLQDVVKAVSLAKSFHQRQQDDAPFSDFYDNIVCQYQELTTEPPQLTRYRRAPLRLDRSQPPQYATSKEFY